MAVEHDVEHLVPVEPGAQLVEQPLVVCGVQLDLSVLWSCDEDGLSGEFGSGVSGSYLGGCSGPPPGQPKREMHGQVTFGSLGNLGNEKVTLGIFGSPQRMMPPPCPPQLRHPTITGTTVLLLLPDAVVVSKRLVLQAAFEVACVEKSVGATVMVDVAALLMAPTPVPGKLPT